MKVDSYRDGSYDYSAEIDRAVDYLTDDDGPYADHDYVEGSGIIKTGTSYYDANGDELSPSAVEDLDYTYQNSQVVNVDASIDEGDLPDAPGLFTAMASAADEAYSISGMGMNAGQESDPNAALLASPEATDESDGDDGDQGADTDTTSEADADSNDDMESDVENEREAHGRGDDGDEDVGELVEHFLEVLHDDDASASEGDGGEPDGEPIEAVIADLIALNANEVEEEIFEEEQLLNILEDDDAEDAIDVDNIDTDGDMEQGVGEWLPDIDDDTLVDTLDDLGDDGAGAEGTEDPGFA